MKLLIAEDDDVLRLRLQTLFERRGHEVVGVADGTAAWEVLTGVEPPRLALLDWMMTGLDGPDLCRRVRAEPSLKGTYLVLLTARERQQDVLEGLRAGASDYVKKPFDLEELFARVAVGMQVVQLQQDLADRVRELEEALGRVHQLQGLLPICSYCKRIRDDKDYWHKLESYVTAHSLAQFSHGICPDCFEEVIKPEFMQ